MFAGRMFAKSYFAGTYFPPAGGAVVPPPPPFISGRRMPTRLPPEWPIFEDDDELMFWIDGGPL